MENPPENSEKESKKSPFDDLTREDLIKKCKGLLVIAQKAKQAKSDFQNEVESYKLKLEETQKEKHISDENVRTFQELVESLTEQKLTYITELDSAQNKLQTLHTKCQNLEDEISKEKAHTSQKQSQLDELTLKFNNVDSELVSFKRQNKRLEEENEQLINQLTELESKLVVFNEIGLEQREQLRMLEQKAFTDNDTSQVQELTNKSIELENLLQAKQNTIDEYQKHITSNENKIREISKLYESEKENKEKANIKLRIYKEKILKCASCINQLKNTRYVLTKTVQEYSENIPKWQNEIIAASKFLDDQLAKMSTENDILREKLNEIEKKIDDTVVSNNNEATTLQQQINTLTADNNNLLTELQSLQPSYENICNIELPNILKENEFFKEKVDELSDKVDSLNATNSKLYDKIHELEALNNKFKEVIQSNLNKPNFENMQLQIKALDNEKATLVKEKFNAKDNVIELETQSKLMQEELTKLRSDIYIQNQQYENLLREKENTERRLLYEKESEIKSYKAQMKSLEEKHNSTKKEFDDLQDLNALLREEVETLRSSLERPADDNEHSSDLVVSLQADIVKLETKLSAYKQENASLLADNKESRVKVKEAEAIRADYEESKMMLASYKSENAELLNEMKEINQVLKERGESISKLQKAITEMERLIETLEKDKANVSKEKEDLLCKISSMESDIRSAEKKTNNDKELQDLVVKERDNAMKLLQEKDSVIDGLKEEIEKLKHQQTAPVDYPNEDMSTSTISKAEEHSRMKDLDESFEEKYTKLRVFALKLKKKLNETVVQLQMAEKDKIKLEELLNEKKDTSGGHDLVDSPKEAKADGAASLNDVTLPLQEKVKSLTAALEVAEGKLAELNNIKAELIVKSEQLKAESEAHKATKEALEKARRDVKKRSVLSLEIEDYEKSLKDLSNKMEDSKKKMVQMESTIDTQQNTITTMKTQIKLLEDQIESEEKQNRLTKAELHKIQDELRNQNQKIQTKNELISKLERDLEDEKRKTEDSQIETTKLMSQKEAAITSLGQEKLELISKLKKSEFQCADLNEKLRSTVIELEDIKTDYTSYKIRAQAVLRQNQTVDHSQEELLKEEAAALKTQVETLNTQLAIAREQNSELQTAIEVERRRVSEAAAEAKRAAGHTSRVQTDLARLSAQIEAEKNQHKLQVSTLTQCYKSQISELEAKLKKETEELKRQLNQVLDMSQADAVNKNNLYMLPVTPKDEAFGDLDINVSMLPREEGEGSEAAPSSPVPKAFLSGGGRSPVPLERLLEEGVPEDEAFDATTLGLTTDQEINELRKKLQAQQQRVAHVTLLLSESEREGARLAQLCDLLKAEVRRARGSLERTEHAHNAEYMKNVTMKFLTLPPGDERSRLVPVLQKILTLTSDETHKLNAVAKGMDPNTTRGWGSYLPWPGSK